MKTVLSLILCFVFAVTTAQDARTLIQEGIKLHDAGEFDKAIEKYLEALKVEPQNASAYYEAAFSYHLKKDYENATKMADKALELGTDDVKLGAILVKAAVLDDTGNSKDAAKVYEHALKLFPKHYLLWFNYGVTLARLDRGEKAEEAYINALTYRFNHPGSHLQLANLKREQGIKAPAALAYYFFLLVESNTARSKEAANKLLTMIYGDPADSTKNNKTIIINAGSFGPRGNPSILGSAELFFGLMGSVSDELDKATGTKTTQQQRFVSDTYKFFGVLSELTENQRAASEKSSKKKKKKKDNGDDTNFYLQQYVPFFVALRDAGHNEAFCYYIMKSTGDPEIQDWLVANQPKIDQFFAWLEKR